MRLSDRVRILHNEFLDKCGVVPETVYLGECESSLLVSEFNALPTTIGTKINDVSELDGQRIHGIAIVRVKKVSHIGFGLDI